MDQKVVAGIGNIYADEILFAARIAPTRIAARLSRVELARLHAAIGHVLRLAVAAEGSSFDTGYRTVLGLEGGFLAQNAMYGRAAAYLAGAAASRLSRRGSRVSIGRPTYLLPGMPGPGKNAARQLNVSHQPA